MNDEPEQVYSEEKKEIQPYVPSLDDYTYPLLKDIILSPELKNSLEDVVTSIKFPEFFSLLGVKPEKVFLFDGPPGTGKTMSTRAVRNELGMSGMNMKWVPYNIGQVGTAYINMGAVNLQNIFDNGRLYAHNGYVVIYFFDEADVVLAQRGGLHSHKEDDKILDCLMKNLQDINSYGNNQFVFFASNFRSAMDTAAIRAGRIDKMLYFPNPGLEERVQGFEYYINRANNATKFDNLITARNYEGLARLTDGMNFADISTIIETAVRSKIYQTLRVNHKRDEKKEIVKFERVSYGDLEQTILQHRKTRSKEKEKREIGFKTNP